MKVLFDINVVLDVLLNREQFVEKSALLMGMVERKKIEGYLCATTVTTLDYLISKALNKTQANVSVQKLLSIFQIAEVNAAVLGLSINSNFNDFEDAVQYYSGVCCNVDCLVTRNIKDYKNAEEYSVYMPDEVLCIIAMNND